MPGEVPASRSRMNSPPERTGRSTTEPTSQPTARGPQRIVLGEIRGAHGIEGEIRVRSSSDSVDPFFELENVWIGRTPSDPEARRYAVLACANARPGDVRLRLEGVNSRDAVGPLIGWVVSGPSSVLPALPEGEFYWYELIGFHVESANGEDVGQVREIWETGAHDVLVVENEDGLRRLIPTAEALLQEIDPQARRIVVVDLPGLLEPS